MSTTDPDYIVGQYVNIPELGDRYNGALIVSNTSVWYVVRLADGTDASVDRKYAAVYVDGPTTLSVKGALATLATLEQTADVRTAVAMIEAAPTTPKGTARAWFKAHDCQHVDTLQFRTWCGHGTLAIWAPLDRKIDASKASYATLNGSMMTYKGVTVLAADADALVTIDAADGFLTFYRLTSARPTVATADAAPEDAPTDPRPTLAIVSDGRPFNVRRVDIGQHYGLTDSAINDGPTAFVEVFDASPELARFGPLGQFVSRYYVDTFAAIVEGVNLDGAVDAWTLTADAVREVQAWLATFDADETPAPTDPENLNGVMEFDHVVRVLPGRIVVDGPEGIYAPTLLDHDIDSDQWSPVGNYTSQQGGGWLMHNCESIGGRMAEDILDEPGVYVAVVAYWSPDENDADDEGQIVEGWAVVRLADEHDPDEAKGETPAFVTFTDEEGDPGSVIGPFESRDAAERWIAESVPRSVANFHSAMTTRLPWSPDKWITEQLELVAEYDADNN